MPPDVVEEPFELAIPEDPARPIRGVVTRPADRRGGSGATAAVPFVLVVPGFKGFFRWGFFPEVQRRLARAGFGTVAFNFSHGGVGPDLLTHDDPDGFEANTYSRELDDVALVRAAVEAGRWPSLDPQVGGIFGHSRGGAISLLHASEAPGLRAVVTWAAIDSVERWDAATREQWLADGVMLVPNARTGQIHRLGVGLLRDAEENAERLDVAAACARLVTPALLLHGEADEVVSVDGLERLGAHLSTASAVRGETHRIPGAGHGFGAVHPFAGTTPELEDALVRTIAFFSRHLGSGAAPPQAAGS